MNSKFRVPVLITLFCCVFTLSLLGQQSVTAGYLVNMRGDTLRGFVKYKSYGEASRSCVFSQSKEAFRSYGPKDIKGYGLESLHHFRSETLEKGEIKFFEIIFEGSFTLYTVRNKKGGTTFYIRSKNGGVEELRIKRQRVGDFVRKADEYRDKLFLIMKADLAISEKINETYLDRKSLIELMVFYEEQRGTDYTIWNKQIRTAGRFYAMGGYNRSSLTLRTQESDANYSGLFLGFGYSKELSRGSGRLWLSIEAQLGGKEYREQVRREYMLGEVINGFNTRLFIARRFFTRVDYIVRFDYEAISVKTPIFLTWYFPAKGFSVGLSGGLVPILDFNQKGITVEELSSETRTYLTEERKRIMPPAQIAFMGGLTVRLQSALPIEFGVRYIKGVRVGASTGALLGINTLQGVVTFPLSRK